MNKNIFINQVQETENTLYRVAKSILFSDKDCEDAVQEGLLKAYLKKDSLKNEAFFKTWLVRIIINECRTIQRKSGNFLPFDDYMEDLAAIEKEDYTDLYMAICRLSEKIRVTVVLYYVEGYSTEEIKKILKIPSGTVKSRLAKGRKELKYFLENEGE